MKDNFPDTEPRQFKQDRVPETPTSLGVSDRQGFGPCGKHPRKIAETPSQAWYRAYESPNADKDPSQHCPECDRDALLHRAPLAAVSEGLEQQAHWHIVHALEYIGNSSDGEVRRRRVKECVDFLAPQLAQSGQDAAPPVPREALREPLPKPENMKWLLDASNQVISELSKQEHLDSDTFRWLCNAVGQVERDLKRAALATQPAASTKE